MGEMATRDLYRKVILRLLAGAVVITAVVILPAGTLAYWQAWVYLAIIYIPLFAVALYYVKHDPQFLERRMRLREKESEQKRIISLAFIPFCLAFVLPGFDHRFDWSHVSTGVVLAADMLVILGNCIIYRVFHENRFASRIIEVEQKQVVIQSGPYAIVRHPMYVGSLLLYICTPLALGSAWAVIAGAIMIPLIIARILNEESILQRDLPGYQEYMRKTRYRLIPGIW